MMTRGISLIVVMLLVCGLSAFAQGVTRNKYNKISIAIGPEFNKNSRENFAGGAVLNFGFKVGSYFAFGINATASYDFQNTFVIEPGAFLRWYFSSWYSLKRDFTGWFLQGDGGASIIIEDGETIPLFKGGGRIGYSFPIGRVFFLETYLRGGYPFMFGVGVLAGVRF